jgi:hypothetical protein
MEFMRFANAVCLHKLLIFANLTKIFDRFSFHVHTMDLNAELTSLQKSKMIIL